MGRKHSQGFAVIELLLVVLVIGLLALAGWFIYNKQHKAASTTPLSSSPGAFKVVGNKIIAPSGQQFVPYGVVIECASLRKTDTPTLCSGQDRTGNPGSAIITTAAKDWNANIVRFQVAQENLFSGPQGSVNTGYLSLVDGLVKQANSLGMVAIITLQEENQGGYAYPTASSTTFWQYMANHYKTSPDVFFDLFNEPQLTTAAFGSNGSESDLWRVWQNGGSADSLNTNSKGVVGTSKVDYVGMQSLINTIRTQGAQNIIVAESPGKDKDLTQLTTHYLTGGNIAYGVEPNLSKKDTNQTAWNDNWGKYTKAVPIMPEAFLDYYGSFACDPNSPTDLPLLFSYLKSLNMGLIFFSLDPNVGIVGNDLSMPTNYSVQSMKNFNSAYCPAKGGDTIVPNNSIGPGLDIQNYFKANSVKL